MKVGYVSVFKWNVKKVSMYGSKMGKSIEKCYIEYLVGLNNDNINNFLYNIFEFLE